MNDSGIFSTLGNLYLDEVFQMQQKIMIEILP